MVLPLCKKHLFHLFHSPAIPLLARLCAEQAECFTRNRWNRWLFRSKTTSVPRKAFAGKGLQDMEQVGRLEQWKNSGTGGCSVPLDGSEIADGMIAAMLEPHGYPLFCRTP